MTDGREGCYRALGIAVVAQAIKDYKAAWLRLQRAMSRRCPDEVVVHSRKRECEKLEQFFRERMEIFAPEMDPEWLIRKCRENANAKTRNIHSVALECAGAHEMRRRDEEPRHI